MYEVSYAPKFEKDLDIAEIAKRLRAEIKAAVKAGDLPACKYSVRISRFAGGCSMDVTIRGYGPVYNRRRLELEHEITMVGREQYRDLYAEMETLDRYTDEAKELLKTVEEMANQWNYDGSESQVDYFHVNYYSDVTFDDHDEWVSTMNEIKGAS